MFLGASATGFLSYPIPCLFNPLPDNSFESGNAACASLRKVDHVIEPMWRNNTSAGGGLSGISIFMF